MCDVLNIVKNKNHEIFQIGSKFAVVLLPPGNALTKGVPFELGKKEICCGRTKNIIIL